MTDLRRWVPEDDLEHLDSKERAWLADIFKHFDGYPSLEELWAVMDESWRESECDPTVMDARIGAFYSHPVWLLNGLFIEQHEESLQNRRVFAEWIAAQSPGRVADYGGGFGSLARLVGEACPSAEVEVIEPHPHPVAIARAEGSANVRYRPQLEGSYDVLVATDVFEHVLDPLELATRTAESLRQGGLYLIANCFEPVILCHLAQTFHFRYSWDRVLRVAGLEPSEKVLYARAFTRAGASDLDAARRLEKRSRRFWSLTQHLHRRVARGLTWALL